jgi:hypothetical protein
MAQRPPRIGSQPTPRDPQTEAVRDQTTRGNPFGSKYSSKGKEQR